MEQKNGLTLTGLVVTLFVVFISLAVLLPMMERTRRTPLGLICGINLKGLGNAMMVYANDYDDYYPRLPGMGSWSKDLGFAYDMEKPDFSAEGAQGKTSRTITASWYLLVREADVSPRSFVCPCTKQQEFNGNNLANRDIVYLWDFGNNPYQHVSYAMHNPYGKFPATGDRSASFAIAADMSPWIVNGDFIPPGPKKTPPQIISFSDKATWKLGNSINHRQQSAIAEGQHVLYADGHSVYAIQPNVGTNDDNIYTYWSSEKNPTRQDKQVGTAPTGRTTENDAKSKEDSFLAI